MKLFLSALVAALALAGSAAARAPSVDFTGSFASAVKKVKGMTRTPVLLPSSLPIGTKHKVYAHEVGNAGSWELDLAYAPDCGNATACFLASFQAARGGPLPRRANAHLANGDPVYFHNWRCGGSCAPASLWFVHRGVLYSWEDSDIPVKTTEAFLLALANEAVAAGPR